ncbi:MAG TPA: hypothetical protein VGN82_22190 [Bosea sp. (in: a-proteobacteria)]|jgi:hypothetical protein|uniref:hypothetical protein n=1 Tax=Bosea sp. (in: a-proteobacteria) TaxID=1871050 RepID=UPI002E15F489|nr:hypothetical protein [Bosea sp. (in: a-proteobacteria)]
MIGRLTLFVLALSVVSPQALAQAGPLEGAWVEEGTACTTVFVSASHVGFRRPASAFAPAFIISGKRLTTPLATCRIAGARTSGQRHLLALRCTTTVSSSSALAVLAPAEGGGLNRFSAAEGGIATRYQRCTPEMLKAP